MYNQKTKRITHLLKIYAFLLSTFLNVSYNEAAAVDEDTTIKKVNKQDSVLQALTSDDPNIRGNALWQLEASEIQELPLPVFRAVVECLNDMRPKGMWEDNTIAGQAAEVLKKHPLQAESAVRELFTLLCRSGYPGLHAEHALGAIRRQAIEQYIHSLSAQEKQEIVKKIVPQSKNVAATETSYGSMWLPDPIVPEILGMMGSEAVEAIPRLEELVQACVRMEQGQDLTERWTGMSINFEVYHPRTVRAATAIRIIRHGWKVGNPKYLAAMAEADDELRGVIKNYAIALEKLKTRIINKKIDGAYILNSKCLPSEWLGEHASKLIIWNSAAQTVYRNSPKSLGTTILIISPNGHFDRELDKMLRKNGVAKGYNDNVLYEFWRGFKTGK